MHTMLICPILFLAILLAFLPCITSLGINCRGSWACDDDGNYFYMSNLNVLSAFYDALHDDSSPYYHGGPINITHVFTTKDHIVCSRNVLGYGGICLFMQGNLPAQGITGQVVLKRLMDLVDHECWVCGSVPLSGDNDPEKMGILTSNYVAGDLYTGKVCDGVCHYD